jgi:hypothetical protein
MKKFILATTAMLSLGVGSALASVTIYTDGSTYNSATGITFPAPTAYAMAGSDVATDAQASHKWNDMKVVRWGPPTGGLGGA